MTMTLENLLTKANRKLDVTGMNKDVAQRVRAVITAMHMQGIYVCVAQGYRSKEAQDALYAQGRTAPGSIVTNAKGGFSNHNYGVAVDLAMYTNDGANVIWTVDNNFRKIVTAMKMYGFKWGGDWKSFKDNPHFELFNVVGGEKIVDLPDLNSNPAPSAPSNGIIGQVEVIVDNLNIRTGPGTQYGKISKAVKGRTYNVTANIGNMWMEIILSDTEKGFVSTGHAEGEEYLALVR